ncbi:MAG: hypothetical protein HY906_15550 [Deltaproteobacteria bacterium]|nr:hypothetical protein [Deltaproteobacteria bacterium]
MRRSFGLQGALGLLLLVAACGGGTAGGADGPVDAGAQADAPPGPPSVEGFRAALEGAGYEVGDGRLEFAQIDCCAAVTCFGNNPSSPYGQYLLPRGPGQPVANPYEDAEGLSKVWRLRPDEAVVFVGPTPPRAAYFGWTGYQFDRSAGAGQARDIRFASLGDTVNVDTIATAGTPAGAAGDPFEQLTVIMLVADSQTEAEVHAAAAAGGFPPAWVNTLVIPAADVSLGLEDEADTFGVLVRAALFEDPTAKEAYLAAPPGNLWRISPAMARAVAPLREPALRPRGTGAAEDAALATALDELHDAILAAHPGLNVYQPPVTDVTPTPGECLTGTRNCNGDNNDTVYFTSGLFRLGETADDFVVVYGVNHQATGKATYSNFALYEVRRLFGVAAASSRDFAGSAAEYLPGHPLADRLYAWRLRRDCTGDPGCLPIALECPGLPADELGVVAFRAYLEPGTGTGPAPSELILDRVIRFKP